MILAGRWSWSAASRSRLDTVHPDLRRVIDVAFSHSSMPYDLTIPRDGGARTLERQQELLEQGKTQILDSRHVTRKTFDLSLAVDVVPYIDGAPRWEWGPLRQCAEVIFRVAYDLRVPVIWGGHWSDFPDGAHWELPRGIYP